MIVIILIIANLYGYYFQIGYNSLVIVVHVYTPCFYWTGLKIENMLDVFSARMERLIGLDLTVLNISETCCTSLSFHHQMDTF